MPVRSISIVNAGPIVVSWLKFALIPRAIGIIVSCLVLAYCLVNEAGFVSVPSSLLIAVLTGVALYLGARVDLSRMRLRSPRWSQGVLLSFLLLATAMAVVDYHSINSIGFLFGLFINISYLGAKYGCARIGCCGIRSIKDRHFFGWPFRPRLQSFELVITMLILCAGVALYPLSSGLAGWLLIAGHVILRVFAACYRFPHRPLKRYIFDVSGGGIMAIGLFGYFAAYIEF